MCVCLRGRLLEVSSSNNLINIPSSNISSNDSKNITNHMEQQGTSCPRLHLWLSLSSPEVARTDFFHPRQITLPIIRNKRQPSNTVGRQQHQHTIPLSRFLIKIWLPTPETSQPKQQATRGRVVTDTDGQDRNQLSPRGGSSNIMVIGTVSPARRPGREGGIRGIRKGRKGK